LTNEQLLNVLAALAGEVVGRSLSPEFFVPVAFAAYYARRLRHLLIYPAACALIGTLVFLALTGRPDYVVGDFLIRYLGGAIIVGFVLLCKSLRIRSTNAVNTEIGANSVVNQGKERPTRSFFNRPHWLEHEGAWRVLQTLRLGVPVLMIGWLAIVTANMRVPDWNGFWVVTLVLVPTGFLGIHYAFRLIKWILAGFSGTSGS